MAIEVEDQTEGGISRVDIQPQEGDHVLGYGMLEVSTVCNVMFTAWVRDGNPMCCQRIRIYVDDKIHDSADERKWYVSTPKKPMTPEQWWAHCLGKFEAMRETMPEPPPSLLEIKYSVTEVNGTYEEWTEKFLAEPYTHVRYERVPPSTAS